MLLLAVALLAALAAQAASLAAALRVEAGLVAVGVVRPPLVVLTLQTQRAKNEATLSPALA